MSLPPPIKYTFKFFCQHCSEVHQPVFDTYEEANTRWHELNGKVQSLQPSIEAFFSVPKEQAS